MKTQQKFIISRKSPHLLSRRLLHPRKPPSQSNKRQRREVLDKLKLIHSVLLATCLWTKALRCLPICSAVKTLLEEQLIREMTLVNSAQMYSHRPLRLPCLTHQREIDSDRVHTAASSARQQLLSLQRVSGIAKRSPHPNLVRTSVSGESRRTEV